MILGALDVGTNTILMLVAECRPDGTIFKLDDMSRIARLGRGVDSNSRLDPAVAGLALAAIEEFIRRARELGAARIVSAATCALRDARDGPEFITRVAERTGVTLDVVSGEEEARLSHLAVVRGLRIDPAERLLIVDIGGGSTEFIAGEPGGEPLVKSLRMGSVRMTERFIKHDPPLPDEIAALRESVASQLAAELGWRLRPDRLVGVAGTVTTICAVVLGLERYDHAQVHGRELGREQVAAVTEKFVRLPLAERKRLPGMAEARAEVIVAGAVILENVMDYFHAVRVSVSDQGVRWGLAYREAARGRCANAATETR